MSENTNITREQKAPDTDVPCAICKGTGKNPRYGHECGACFGFGLSTAPWDQRRHATTVTLWDDEPRTLPADATVAKHTRTSRRAGMRCQQGWICLVTWPNPDYRGGAA